LAALIETKTRPVQIKARTMILNERETCHKMYFINKGCIRVSFNNNGKDVTTQFFFEEDAVTILESFLYDEPSPFSLETIEDCELSIITKEDFKILLETDQEFKEWFYQTALMKLLTLSKRLLSFIINKPQERYIQLMSQQPQLLQRAPQHFIASFLGITPVSLSRIRNRKSIY
jgi:CRP-like cAMP-binding protein